MGFFLTLSREPVSEFLVYMRRLPGEYLDVEDQIPEGAAVESCFAEIKVGLHCVAQRLLEMRAWLVRSGCGTQVFQCSPVGTKVRIRVEFDSPHTGLRDDFQRAFTDDHQSRSQRQMNHPS